MSENNQDPRSPGRRRFLNKALLGAVGVGAAYGLEEKILLAALHEQADRQEKPRPTFPRAACRTGRSAKSGSAGSSWGATSSAAGS